MEFTAKSGNRAVLKMIASGDRAVIDATWDETATASDMQELNDFIRQQMKPEELRSIVEEDPAKRAAITWEQLIGRAQ